MTGAEHDPRDFDVADHAPEGSSPREETDPTAASDPRLLSQVPATSASRSSAWRLAGGLGIIAALVAAVLLIGGNADGDAEMAGGSGLRPAVGAVDAPVVMQVWTDFGCSYCARHAAEVEPALIERDVAAGRLRIEWYDFPAQGEASLRAAVAARAAGQQGRYHDYANLLYANQHQFAREDLVAYARQLGLDTEQFARDLDSPLLQSAVERDYAEGQAKGVRATPTFLLNDQPLVGAQPAAVFEEALDHLTQG